MTTTPQSISEESLGESWVDLSDGTPDRVTPLPSISAMHLSSAGGLNGEMARLLWEAQKESNQSSARVSGASSRRGSPKSPPNSPNTEPSVTGSDIEGLKDVFINTYKDDLLGSVRTTDWVWDWSSRPDQQPPKEWSFSHPKKTGLSMRHSKVIKGGLSSANVLSLVVFTNLVSILIGAGLGYYFGKRFQVSSIALD